MVLILLLFNLSIKLLVCTFKIHVNTTSSVYFLIAFKQLINLHRNAKKLKKRNKKPGKKI